MVAYSLSCFEWNISAHYDFFVLKGFTIIRYSQGAMECVAENVEQSSNSDCSPESSKHPFNKRMIIVKRYLALRKFNPKEFGRATKERYLNQATAAKAGLNALRKIYQPAINEEIREVVQRYADQYFAPAVRNVCQNVDGTCSQQLLHTVCRNVLEEAKQLFPLAQNEGLVKKSNDRPHPSPVEVYNEHRKRTNAYVQEAPYGNGVCKSESEMSEGSPLADVSQSRYLCYSNKRIRTKLASKIVSTNTVLEKWNPSRLTENSEFVLGPQANSALGYAAQRGRIYTKYPSLFKVFSLGGALFSFDSILFQYIGDNDDRQWLIDQKLKRMKNGGKVFLVLLEDIIELASTPECRDNPEVDLSMLEPFKLPLCILDKVKYAMAEVYNGMKMSSSASRSRWTDGLVRYDPVC
ncbi:deoxynucleotidyltransferase terminal interacting [Trichuris trichiura]|uniref:Deoxynucleotidyltransferase terminal interacting n=1 Tax=Trichuris trichiura TaxID=36087 RepID=A0A077ZE47_TRITR|nr:deoxynucleotidyltransferase terminal interacting [Trichuris trichiura]